MILKIKTAKYQQCTMVYFSLCAVFSWYKNKTMTYFKLLFPEFLVPCLRN